MLFRSPGSEAEKGGVRVGDVILQLAGTDPPRNLDAWARSRLPGESIVMRVRRDGEELELRFALGQRGERGFEIEEDGQASEKARRIREGILRGKTD